MKQKEIVLSLSLDFTESLARLLELKQNNMSFDEFKEHIIAVARLRGIEPLQTKQGFEFVIPTPDNFKSDLMARILDINLIKNGKNM